MDFEKVNLELIEALLEWIVDGKHSYPPGNYFFILYRMIHIANPQSLTVVLVFLSLGYFT
jgi:hypothetical protein